MQWVWFDEPTYEWLSSLQHLPLLSPQIMEDDIVESLQNLSHPAIIREMGKYLYGIQIGPI
jgi:hypothetical protein